MRKTANQIERLNQQTHDAAQSNIPGQNIKNQLPGAALPPSGNTGSGYTPADHDHTAPGDGGALTNELHDGYSVYAEIAAPSAPAANTARLYGKDIAGVTELFYKNSAGTERNLSSTSATPLSNANPADIGTTAPGVATDASRADHVHALPNTAVTPGTYGDGTHVAQLTVDAKGRVTAATDVLISGGGGSGLPWFNVLDYGAVGDGSTNDTTAIAAAIAALTSAGRGKLYFPAGTYSTTGGFTLSVPCTVEGDGESGADTSGSSYSISKVTCSNTTAVLFLVTAGDVTFRSLGLEHIGGFLPSAGAGIRAAHPSDPNARVNYENLTVRRFWINVDSQVGVAWHMQACTIGDAVKYGLKIQNTVNSDAGDWMISDCVFADTLGADANIRMETSGGGKIVNCKFNGGGSGSRAGRHVDMLATGSPTSILLISNSSFENYGGDAIHLEGPDWDMIVVTGCQFGQYTNTTGHAILIDSLNDIVITGCHFRCPSGSVAAIDLTSVNRAYIGAVTNNGYSAVLAQSGCTAVIDMSAGGGGGGGGFTNPMTTAGDLITGGSSGTPQRLAVGTSGQILTVVSGVPAWDTAPTGGGEWSVLTNGDTAAPELVFVDGDVVMVFTG